MARRLTGYRRSINDNDKDDDDLTDEKRRRRALIKFIFTIIKIAVFVIIWAVVSTFLIITPAHNIPEMVIPLKPNKIENIEMDEKPKGDAISIEAIGYINVDATNMPELVTEDLPNVIVTVESVNTESKESLWNSSEWKIYLDLNSEFLEKVKKYISLNGLKGDSESKLQVSFLNKHNRMVPFSLFIDPNPLDLKKGAVVGFLLLLFLYTLIIFDLTDRTFATIMSATAAIGCLCWLGERPSLHTIVTWIDMHTLMLLFGMMIMVAVLTETGIFDYLSVVVLKMSKGKIWRLLFYLYLFTGVLSAFLDNVTIVMLMVPIAIRLSETMALRTTTVLISVAIVSNIGGTLTPVGDPPNAIIATDTYLISHDVDFAIFMLHMFPGVLISIVFTFLMLYFMTRKRIFTLNSDQIERTLKILQRQADEIKDKNTLESRQIENRIAELKKLVNSAQTPINYEETLATLKSKYKIRNSMLLIKCGIALFFALLLFFLHTLPFMRGATLSWAAMLAAILLLILINKPDIDGILEKVEWTTLLFFAALFVFMEALVAMGLLAWIGERIEEIILRADKENQLTVSILLILWISAITSAIVDNIPVTTMMLKLTVQLAKDKKLNLSLTPLIWALSFGVCFGGNGTLIGASANVVTAGLATRRGYKVSFGSFFLMGFPIMLVTIAVATIYLLIAHSLFSWH